MTEYIFVCKGKHCCIQCRVLKTSPSQVYPTDCLYGKGRERCSWGIEEVPNTGLAVEVVPEEENATLPDWVKVGAWVWTSRTGYFKVTEIEGGSCICGKSANGDGQTVLGEPVSEVRIRPWNDEELKNKVGNAFENENRDDGAGVLYFAGKGPVVYPAKWLAESNWTLDGSPCGVLEHKNEQGEWVR